MIDLLQSNIGHHVYSLAMRVTEQQLLFVFPCRTKASVLVSF